MWEWEQFSSSPLTVRREWLGRGNVGIRLTECTYRIHRHPPHCAKSAYRIYLWGAGFKQAVVLLVFLYRRVGLRILSYRLSFELSSIGSPTLRWVLGLSNSWTRKSCLSVGCSRGVNISTSYTMSISLVGIFNWWVMNKLFEIVLI